MERFHPEHQELMQEELEFYAAKDAMNEKNQALAAEGEVGPSTIIVPSWAISCMMPSGSGGARN
jgi:hypothetical protein